MYWTYALQSQNHKYLYVGLTNSIERRLTEHNAGKNRTTKPYRPFVLIYSKGFNTRAEARKAEKKLKSGSGKEFLKSL
jgi:putative endonuclease